MTEYQEVLRYSEPDSFREAVAEIRNQGGIIKETMNNRVIVVLFPKEFKFELLLKSTAFDVTPLDKDTRRAVNVYWSRQMKTDVTSGKEGLRWDQPPAKY